MQERQNNLRTSEQQYVDEQIPMLMGATDAELWKFNTPEQLEKFRIALGYITGNLARSHRDSAEIEAKIQKVTQSVRPHGT